MLKTVLYSLYRKKAIIASLLFLLLFLFTIQTQAQNPWFDPSTDDHTAALQECLDGNVGLECTVQAIVSSIENSLVQHTGPRTLAQGPGTINVATSLIITTISTQPISSGQYVQYVAQKINPVDPVYAQGSTGFRALSALIKLWTAFRNVAYLAFVVIFIFIGFMIMFRAKLDPQTVVNVQNALPKLVVTLILITFSYAIAGFMVDLIYLGIFLSISVLASQGLIENSSTVREAFLSESIFTMANKAGFYGWTDSLGDAIDAFLHDALDQFGFWGWLGQKVPFVDKLAALIIQVAILFSLFKVFFQLIIAYVNIILSTLFSPLMILLNALPGSQSFSSWIRNFLSNVLIFPAVAMMFLISAILIGRNPVEGEPPGGWVVPEGLFETNDPWTPPFIAVERTSEAVMGLIGIGFILFTPQMVTVLQQALKAKPLPTAGVFAPIATGAGIVTGTATAPFRGIGRAASGGARTFFQEKVERIARRGEAGGRRF